MILFTDLKSFEKWLYKTASEMEEKMKRSTEKKMEYEKFTFESPNFENTFQTRDCYLQIRHQPEEADEYVFEISFNYVIVKCHPNAYLDHTIGPTDDLSALFKNFLDFFWKKTTCPECLTGLRDPTMTVCESCIPKRILTEYALEHGIKKEIDVCPVCMERVYFSKLQCGHYIHKSCMVNLSESDWFDDEACESKRLRCPLCRKLISSSDIKSFFMAKEV